MSPREVLPLLTILFAVGALMGSRPLAALAAALVLAVLGADFWGRRSLSSLSFRQELHPARVFPGEPVELKVTWENRKWLPLAWLESEAEVPADLAFPPAFLQASHRPERERLVNILPLGMYERVSRRFRLELSQRGAYRFGPGRLRSGDLFGLVSREREEPGVCELLVYPRLIPLEQFGLPALRPVGNRRWGPPFFEDPSRMSGSREYRPGDPLGRMDWKATARTGQLQVRVYEPSTTLSLGLFFNCATFPNAWQGINRQALERVIEVTASLASEALSQGHQVGLYANGLLPGVSPGLRLPPAAGPQQLQRVLESLARVAPFGSERLPDLLAWEGKRLPGGASVVLVTAVLTEETVLALQGLRRQGRPVALVTVGEEHIPPDLLEGLPVVHRLQNQAE